MAVILVAGQPNCGRTNKLRARVRHIVVMAMICMFALGSEGAQAGQKRHVLVLNSYHQGFPWTDSIMRGIQSVFTDGDVPAELYIEYMDLKRFQKEKSLPHFRALYDDRYRRINFDVIVVSDDFALDFALSMRPGRFTDVPIVFCGVNNFRPERIAGHDKITGVAEDVDIKGILNLALSMHPNTQTIAAVSDSAPPGVAMLKRVREDMTAFPHLKLIELFDLSASDLKHVLRRLGDHTVILHLHYYTDKGSGRSLTVDQSFDITRGSTDLPIYTGWDFQLGYGATGGVVTNGEVQGRMAAEMAMRIIKGESAEGISVESNSPNTPMFDYRYLAKSGLSLGSVPRGSYVLNRPKSFYFQYKSLIWTVSGMIVSLFMFNIILFYQVKKRKRAEMALLKYQNHLEELVSERTKVMEQAMAEIKQLSGLLPVCTHCKMIRDDNGYWNRIEAYLEEHSDADVSHSICPRCAKKHYSDIDIYNHDMV